MSDLKPVRFGLVGIGGYAKTYVHFLLELEKEGLAEIAGLVIRTRGKYPDQEAKLAGHTCPVRSDLAEMLAKDKGALDIVALPVGIDSHREQMIQAVEAGLSVLLEKPSAATVQDLDLMEAALKRTGRFCQIGFQSQFSPNIIALKKAICAGRLGEIKEVIVKGFWMRDNHYYARNKWAGVIRDPRGVYVLDGTINNPMAHYLFNGLYFASTQWARAALPRTVRAELYHGHDIESEDTSCLEVLCENGARVYFYGTLCAKADQPIAIEITGTKGRATWDASSAVKLYEGETQTEELPRHADSRMELFRNTARYFRGEDSELYCPLALTRAHVLAVNGAFLSTRRPAGIAAAGLTVREETEPKARTVTIINGIEEIVERAAKEHKLFSDIGVPWAVKTAPVNVADLKTFAL